MFNKVKKIIAVLMAMAVILSFNTVAFAAEAETSNVGIDEKVTVINEYDYYEDMMDKSNAQLKKDGLTNEEIKSLRSFDYEEAIKERAALSNKELKSCGYTSSEISELRAAAKLDDIPAQTMAKIASSTLTTYIKVVKKGTLTENNKKVNYVDLEFSFKWNKSPLMHFIDIVAIAYKSTNSSAFVYKKVDSYRMQVNHTKLGTNQKSPQYVNWTYKMDSNGDSLSAKFAIFQTNAQAHYTHFANDGKGKFRLTNSSNKARLNIDAAYGHAVLSINPTYSISTSGVSVGIKFSGRIDEQHNKGCYYADFKIDKSYIYEGDVRGI